MPKIINITDKISYLPASENPLSADIGIVEGEKALWLFDLGNSERAAEMINSLEKPKNAVISHFHKDHLGNLERVGLNKLYLGANTFNYAGRGEIVREDTYVDDGVKLRIFPLPSSHAKGSLGLEVNGEYAFLGDGVYPGTKSGQACYNASLLKEEITVLKTLNAKYFLLSHDENFVRKREDVLKELEEIYSQRDPKGSYIFL